MTSDLDIFRTANVLVKHYGEDAALEAAQSADAMLEKGCLDGPASVEARSWRPSRRSSGRSRKRERR
jgi:hypothetical protein